MTTRPLALAVLAAAAFAPAAAAQAPQPTLQFDRPCYASDQPMPFTGGGFTPSGPVQLTVSNPAGPQGWFDVTADAAGAIAGSPAATEDTLLVGSEARAAVVATATDRAGADAWGAQPPESPFATAHFTFTRWAGFSPGRYQPGRKVEVEAYGWAFAAGRTVWFQFRKGSRLVRSVKVGRLAGECGDLVKRIRVPRGLKPGSYRLVLSTDERGMSGPYTWRNGRVTRRAAAASTSRAMLRG